MGLDTNNSNEGYMYARIPRDHQFYTIWHIALKVYIIWYSKKKKKCIIEILVLGTFVSLDGFRLRIFRQFRHPPEMVSKDNLSGWLLPTITFEGVYKLVQYLALGNICIKNWSSSNIANLGPLLFTLTTLNYNIFLNNKISNKANRVLNIVQICQT